MLIDVNVSLSRWPSRRLPYDETSELIEKLKSVGVEHAWVGSFDALLHLDLAAVNERLHADCEKSSGFLVPMGAVNPTLPGWQEDLQRCIEKYAMPGVRLHPDYHGYPLDDPQFIELLRACDQQKRLVQIAVSMEDQRTQHPLLRVAPVDLRPLKTTLAAIPHLRVVLLNALRGARLEDAGDWVAAGDVYVEIATLEGVTGIDKLLKQVPMDRILFGTDFPFFYHESAQLKLKESELAEVQRRAISRENALRLIPIK